jgi:hypothetical protein
LFEFPALEARHVVAAFDGGAITSDAGALLLGQTDRAIRLTERFAACFTDTRAAELVEHRVETIVMQRVIGIALGYEDLNDHDELRHDPVLAVLAPKLEAQRSDCAPLAGTSTLNRLELSRAEPPRYHKISHDPAEIENLFVDLFLDAPKKAPKQIVLDLDATDDPLHGNQEGKFFHGYYDCYTARCFKDFSYATLSTWSCERRVIGKAEVTGGEANPRFIVTSLKRGEASAQHLYEKIYCSPGDMENRIKECQLDLFADRTSTATMQANQLRLWLASMAYVLLCALRRIGLAYTQFAEATCGTIRLRLLKIGALVRVSVRRIKIAMASACPGQDAFALAHARLRNAIA